MLMLWVDRSTKTQLQSDEKYTACPRFCFFQFPWKSHALCPPWLERQLHIVQSEYVSFHVALLIGIVMPLQIWSATMYQMVARELVQVLSYIIYTCDGAYTSTHPAWSHNVINAARFDYFIGFPPVVEIMNWVISLYKFMKLQKLRKWGAIWYSRFAFMSTEGFWLCWRNVVAMPCDS